MLTRIRGRHLFLLDLAVIALSIVGAMLLRFDSLRFREEALIYFPAALFPLFVRPPVNAAYGLYSRAWAYASVGELARIIVAAVTGTVLGIAFFYGILVPLGVRGTVADAGTFPRSFFVLEGLLTLAGLVRPFPDPGQQRVARHARNEPRQAWRRGSRARPDARLRRRRCRGAGPAHDRRADDGLGMRVVGFSTTTARSGTRSCGAARSSAASTSCPTIARVTGARRLLIAIPSASGDVVRRAVEDAHALGLETRTVPALDELVSGRLGAAAIREVEVTDLLRRDPVVIERTRPA